MAHPHWPFFDLRIVTPRLELRYPDDDLLCRLVDVAAKGVHDPARMPFNEPWTRTPPGELERKALQHWWTSRATLTADDWSIPFAVLEKGRVVGVQSLFSKEYSIRRSFETESWLGIDHHGRGIGTEMRAAVLHLGFDGLDAELAETGAFEDNPESQGVTRKLGYDPNGRFLRAREGKAAGMLMYSMTRAAWQLRRRDDVTIHDLESCLALLGLGAG